jgi:hypothetical protein
MNPLRLLSFYTVTHRLPGRIRLHVPVLERLTPDWQSLTAKVQEVITVKKGIRRVKIEPRAGSVLLQYDPHLTNESEVLRWLEQLVRLFMDLKRCGQTPSREQSLAMLQLIKRRLE